MQRLHSRPANGTTADPSARKSRHTRTRVQQVLGKPHCMRSATSSNLEDNSGRADFSFARQPAPGAGLHDDTTGGVTHLRVPGCFAC